MFWLSSKCVFRYTLLSDMFSLDVWLYAQNDRKVGHNIIRGTVEVTRKGNHCRKELGLDSGGS